MKEELSHLSNLVALIYEDGKLDKKELDLLYSIAERYNIDEDDVITMLNQQEEYEFVLPENEKERLQQLKDLISMMMVDGIMSPDEKDLIYKTGEKLGFEKDFITGLIAS